jgi:hypothetical protein
MMGKSVCFLLRDDDTLPDKFYMFYVQAGDAAFSLSKTPVSLPVIDFWRVSDFVKQACSSAKFLLKEPFFFHLLPD